MSERATKRPLSSIPAARRVSVKNVQLRHFVIGAGAILNIADATAAPRFRPILRRSAFADVINLTSDGVKVRGYLKNAYRQVTKIDAGSPTRDASQVFDEPERPSKSEIQLALFAS